MAKTSKDFSASNAMIDFEQMKIVEFPKKKDDEVKVYDLTKILKEWNEIRGISFKIGLSEDIEPESNTY
jgi:hypothetical protein